METLLETLQITRVLVAGFALGGLDTCVRAAVSYARSRRLYGGAIIELEPVARRLVDAYTELLIGETVALGACRAVQLCPEQLPLTSACVKYPRPADGHRQHRVARRRHGRKVIPGSGALGTASSRRCGVTAR